MLYFHTDARRIMTEIPDADESMMTRESLAAMLAANPTYQAALLASESESWDGPGAEASAVIEAANERRRENCESPEDDD